MHAYRSIRVRPKRGAPLLLIPSVCLPLSLLEREEKSGEPSLASTLLFIVVLLFLFIVNPRVLAGGCHVVLFLSLSLSRSPLPLLVSFFSCQQKLVNGGLVTLLEYSVHKSPSLY